MNHSYAAWIMLLSGWSSAFSQDLSSSAPIDQSDIGGFTHDVTPNHLANLINPVRPEQPGPFILVFENLTPAPPASDHLPATQIPEFGGALQSYAIMNAASTLDSTKPLSEALLRWPWAMAAWRYSVAPAQYTCRSRLPVQPRIHGCLKLRGEFASLLTRNVISGSGLQLIC
jgi:hypothetical protein